MHISLMRINCIKCNKQISAINKTKCCLDCYEPHLTRTHNKSYTFNYWRWRSIKTAHRRGMQMEESWKNSFVQFSKDMGESLPGESIRRIKKSRGFFKDNCVWVSRQVREKTTEPFKEYLYKVENPAYKKWLKMTEYARDNSKELEKSWKYSFENFLNDMGYCKKTDILMKLDKKKGYTKDNIRWGIRIVRK